MTAPERDAVTGGRRFRSLEDPETLLLIAQNLEEGIYITNASGEILDANPAFLRMGQDGTPGVVVAGRTVAVAVAADGAETLDARDIAAIEAGW